MTEMELPILYSFRRCPYAIRARLALAASGTGCELREIVLRDKAAAFLKASPKGTVPVLVTRDGTVIDQSFDIMMWALERADPEGWLTPGTGTRDDMLALIATSDGDFKTQLDFYKYANGDENRAASNARANATAFLRLLDTRLKPAPYLFGVRVSLADMAIAPFIRQFAHVDRVWFDSQDWPYLTDWLDGFLASARFQAIMTKYPRWYDGDAVTVFPTAG